MTFQDLIDVIGQTGPMVFLCWYILRLKRENVWLRQKVNVEESPQPLPKARASYKRS